MIAVLFLRTWLCGIEKCKIARSVLHNSSRLEEFSCQHIDKVKTSGISASVAVLKPNLDDFVCSESLRNSMKEVIDTATSTKNVVTQVSDLMFCVVGPTTASNPLGFCHVHKTITESDHFICTELCTELTLF